LKSNYTRLSPK